jgi:hypothetical protein
MGFDPAFFLLRQYKPVVAKSHEQIEKIPIQHWRMVWRGTGKNPCCNTPGLAWARRELGKRI